MASKVPIPPPDRAALKALYIEDEMSMLQISKKFGVGIGTVHKWIHDYGIEARQKVNGNFRGAYKEIKGIRHKRCPGPEHEGERYLPLDYFYTRSSGNPHSYCIRCEGSDGRMVEFSVYYKGWIKSIVNRLGISETQRRLEISERTYQQWMKKPPKKIFRRNARAIVHLMRELRHTGEVRHKHSIHRGAKLRGEAEREIKKPSDLYFSNGDSHADYKRKWRASDPEISKRESEARKQRRVKSERERLTASE